MKVLGLKVQNLRNVELVDIKLDGRNWVEITGDNGSGKTTLLDGIFTALLGTKHFGRGYPAWRVVQEGKDKAMIKATIGDRNRQIEVRRSITVRGEKGEKKTGGSLAFTDTAGERLGQEFLDGLLSEFTVDPLAFARRNPKDQAEIVRKLAGIDDEEYANRRKIMTDDRRDATANIKRLKTLTAEEPPDVEAIDISAVIKEKQGVIAENDAKGTRNEGRWDQLTEIGLIESDIEKMTVGIAELEETLRKDREELQTTKEKLVDAGKKSAALGENEEILSIAQFDQAIATAAATNEQCRRHQEWAGQREDLKTDEASHKQADDGIKALAEERKAKLQASNLPFKNLTFDDDVGLLIGGIPFDQKSSAEQLRISTRIGMEMKPEMEVICIREGALLDEESYSVLRELSERHNYQVLVETVGEKQGEDQLVLRAGQVISAFEKASTPKETARDMEDNL